jgi:hypothetical protein
MWVEGRGQIELYTDEGEQFTLELTGEHQIAIAHNGSWNSMEAHDGVEECLRDGCCGVGRPSAMKCAYMENRSTTVRMTVLTLTWGKPLLKSMVALAHTDNGTPNN